MEPSVLPPRSSGMTVMSRALRLRCPICGQGRLFRRFTMLTHCARCGFHFEREIGYFTNTAVINYAVASLPILFVVAPLAYLRPHALALEIGLGFLFAITLPILCFRHVRSIWLAIDVLARPPVAVEFDTSDEVS